MYEGVSEYNQRLSDTQSDAEAEAKNPDELVRVVSFIQLWLAQQNGLIEQSCRDAVG